MGTHDRPPPDAPENGGILASTFHEVAPTADQGLQTNEHPHDDESFAASMATRRGGAPTTGPAPTSALQHTVQNREPNSPARNPASTSHQAHLRRQYAPLGSVAATHATTAGGGHAGGPSVEVTSQCRHAQDALTHGVQTPAAASTVSGPVEWVPPRVAQPCRQESLDCRSPGPPTWSSSLSSSGPGGSSWLYTTSGTAPAPWRTSNSTTVRGDTCRPPTMEQPNQWRYVATCLMAHMGAYTPDDLNRLHCWWHHRAALRIPEAPIQQIIWTIRTPLPWGPPTPDRGTGHQRQRSPTAQGPPTGSTHQPLAEHTRKNPQSGTPMRSTTEPTPAVSPPPAAADGSCGSGVVSFVLAWEEAVEEPDTVGPAVPVCAWSAAKRPRLMGESMMGIGVRSVWGSATGDICWRCLPPGSSGLLSSSA